jgi:signal transduction histidine kinase
VRAMALDGTVSVHPASVLFTIVPPLWQRGWFMVAAALAGMVTLYALFRYRLYHLMKLERLRLRIAGDLHDDVGTNLSSIVIASQIMERQPGLTDGIREQLADIRQIAAGTHEMMRDIVWMLNPANDSLDDFMLKLKEAAGRLLAGVPYTFTVTPGRLLEKVSIDFKRNVLLIFKELLSNIVRHSGATSVIIDVSQENGGFLLHVNDNGRGFQPEAAGLGSGLASLRRRAAILGGSLEIESTPGKGTRATLTLKNHANA